VSIGNVAVELAERVFGTLPETRILVLGTGEVGHRVLQALVSRGANQVSVASRTFENARKLAEEFSGASLSLADALRQAHTHDVIVGCASVDRALLDATALKDLVERRRGQPVLLIDLGVPRNFDIQGRQMNGIYFCDLDDLAQVANANLKARLAEVERARVALAEKAARTWGAANHRTPFGTP
jgi:glutamyl-tRNA reductase